MNKYSSIQGYSWLAHTVTPSNASDRGNARVTLPVSSAAPLFIAAAELHIAGVAGRRLVGVVREDDGASKSVIAEFISSTEGWT